MLPERTLIAELQQAVEHAGPWLDHPLFAEAVRRCAPIVTFIDTPTVPSNSDYNPGNSLFEERQLTGFVDFAAACLEDPHVGMAKYWTHGWDPRNHAGITDRYARRHGLSTGQFAIRLAVRCLSTLQENVPVTGARALWRDGLLRNLSRSLEDLK